MTDVKRQKKKKKKTIFIYLLCWLSKSHVVLLQKMKYFFKLPVLTESCFMLFGVFLLGGGLHQSTKQRHHH